MKKSVAFLITLCLIIGTVAMTGCNTNPITNPGSDYEVDINLDSEVKGTLDIGITSEGTEKTMLESLVKEYNQIYPNVKINLEQIPEPYNNSLVSYYQADSSTPGTMPDILMSNSSDMHPIIGEESILLNLQPYINASVKAGKLNLSDYYEEMWLLGKKDYSGDQFLIPRSSDRVVTHINEKIFTDCFSSYESAGKALPFTPIEGTFVPANGWTWDEFLATCAALRQYYDENGKRNLYLIDSYLSWEAVFYPIFRANGAELINKETGAIIVNSQQTRAALEMMKVLIQNRYAAPFNSSSQANYEGGQGAMMFHSAYASRWVKTLKEQYNLTTFPLIGSNPYIGTGVAGYGIYSRTPNRDLAWTFVSFVLTRDGQNALAAGGMTTNPIRKDMADSATNNWGKEYVSKGINMAAYTYGTNYCIPTDFFTYYKTDMYSDLLDAASTMVTKAMGSMSITDAMRECEDTFKYVVKG